MLNLRQQIDTQLQSALSAAGVPDKPALVAPAGRPEFGDYQANGAMAAAKALRRNPRELATEVAARLTNSEMIDKAEVGGPGFINLHLRDAWLAAQLNRSIADAAVAGSGERVVIDYSSPNLAKEMHVGHLRSTIIGDALARTFAHLGFDVIRQNHLGDWGTQFGMLITRLDEVGASGALQLADIEAFYVEAKKRFDEDPAFADKARRAVVALQSGDQQTLASWRRFVDLSYAHCEAIYQRLGVTLRRTDIHAESDYNDALPGVIETLQKQQGLLTESDGALCVFLSDFKGKDGNPLPIIVRKSDGGYLYATTDLAAARYRTRQLGASRVIYVVGMPQTLHFRQLFTLARVAEFVPANTKLEHCAFGSVLGKDNRPFRTREGGNVKLTELLDEAERRARALIDEKSTDYNDEERAALAHAVGIGAIKYADLSKNRTSDYQFDWDQMLSFDGNTAPYLQYAYVRINSIFRRGGAQIEAALSRTPAPLFSHERERQLALVLLRFGETLDAVARDCLPHFLCGYLYDLAAAFMQFFESCPVLDAREQDQAMRALLCRRTRDVLGTGLDLLGIATVNRM